MKRFPYLVLLVALFLSACGMIPGLLSPTLTPLPTNTLPPTVTPPPTVTATPLPTATPDAAATAAVKATQAADDVLNELDKSLGDSDIPYKDGHLAWQRARSLRINMSGPDQEFLEIDDELTAGDGHGSLHV